MIELENGIIKLFPKRKYEVIFLPFLSNENNQSS
jgi:hypothetical protein